MAQQNLQWGVIGTGAIATDFATALQNSERCRIVNVTSFPGLAQPFADKFGIPRATDSLDALLGDAEVQAVYVATPHPLHEKLALAAIAAGKHVLVEKPMATSSAAAARIIEAARQKRVFVMEAKKAASSSTTLGSPAASAKASKATSRSIATASLPRSCTSTFPAPSTRSKPSWWLTPCQPPKPPGLP